MADYETTQTTTDSRGALASRTTKGKGYTPPSQAAADLETKGYGAGAPKREDFGPGGAGDAEYSKATRRFLRAKQEGQQKALATPPSD